MQIVKELSNKTKRKLRSWKVRKRKEKNQQENQQQQQQWS